MADGDPIIPDPTWKYGNFDNALLRVGIEHKKTPDEMVIAGLEAADAFIESELSVARLDLPTSPYSSVIVQAATSYAIGDALQPYFNSAEDKNEKVLFYIDQAEKLIRKYVQTELDKKAMDGTDNGPNPYSSSKTPGDTCLDMDQLIL